jgi:hypothetical protein
LLAHGRWFSPGTPFLPLKLVAMILLKVALNSKYKIKSTWDTKITSKYFAQKFELK